MRAELVTSGGLDITLSNLPDGTIDMHTISAEFEGADGRLTIEEAKELRTALDIIIGAA